VKGAASDNLLDTYEPERIAFARRLVATTDRGFALVTNRSSFAAGVRKQIVPRVAPLLFRIRVMRRFLFTTVSQTLINYRDSALSVGAAGKVQGGDRLPWVKLASGGDNFAPLTSLAWQVHVYGEVKQGVREACAELRLALHAFAWESTMEGMGLQTGALYLLRPDGYIALADPASDPKGLRQYFAARDLTIPS
jgi:hypothetical protein